MTVFSAGRVRVLALLVLGAASFGTSASAWARFDADEPAAPEAAESDKAAAEDPAAEEPAAAEATPTPEAPAKDIYAVPEGASAKDLVRFIEELKETRPDLKSREEYTQHLTKQHQALLTAAEQILASKPDAEIEGTGLRTQLESYWMLARLSDPTALEKLTKLADSLTSDARPEVAADANFYHLVIRYQQISAENPKASRELITDTIAQLKKEPLDVRLGQIADAIPQTLEQTGQPELALEALQSFTTALSGSDNPQVEGMVQQWEGTIRKLSLIGNPIDIEGALVGGETFDWSAYKGKVVLVDFWATWCGPCIQEMPNVVATYEKFHAQGFEVIGISLDDDKAALEAFITEHKVPWPILFGTAPEAAGWKHPMATKYGIMSIPAAVLVAADGNVVTLSARGEMLPKLVEELLAKVEPAPELKAKAPAKTPAKAKTPAPAKKK